MHQMAFVYDLLFQSKIVSGYTKHEKEPRCARVCVCVFTNIFVQYIFRSFFISIHLSIFRVHEITKVNNHPRERERTKKNSSVISRTRTVNKNNMLVLRLYHFHSIFEHFDSSECVRAAKQQRAFVYCLFCIQRIHIQYSFRFISHTKI